MEQRIGYKVITKDRYSALIIESVAAIRYPVQKTVKPKDNCGPICVFRTAIQAKTFIRRHNSSRYLMKVKCSYEESDYKAIWTVTPPRGRVPLWCLPVGTALADSVTCLE